MAAKIRWEDQEVDLAEDWRVGELIEAENALKLDMNSATGAAQMALVLFISIRRSDRQTPQGVLADKVLRMEITSIVDDDEPEDVDVPLVNGDVTQEIAGRLTFGSQPTATGSM